jgi:hypothetical protein
MKKIVIRYGAYAGLFELICFILTWLIIDIAHVGHKVQGIIGWFTILCPMIFVYFGIRYYRDQFNNGYISFFQALKLGVLIVIIPTISFAIIETVYVLYIDPKFYENIALYDIAQYRKTLPPAEFAAKAKEIQQNLVMYKNPLYNFMGMIFTIGFLGIIAAIISALLLFRRTKKTVAMA